MKTTMKLLSFFSFHILVFGLIFWIASTYLAGPFENTWWWGFNWIRHTIVVIAKAAFWTSLFGSILSCFSSKKLKTTDIGQWTLAEWMPYWGRNEKNSWYGLFTGLPAYMVDIKVLPGIIKPIKKVHQIQIEIEGDPEKKKFLADFDFNFKRRIANTWVHITNVSSDENLLDIVITALNDWLNDPCHCYTDIVQLKAVKVDIQRWVEESLGESLTKYGDEMVDFQLVDIQEPAEVIKQRIKDAAARNEQLASDQRDVLNTKALRKEAKRFMKESEDSNGVPTLKYDAAMTMAMKAHGMIKATETRITGSRARAAVVRDVV